MFSSLLIANRGEIACRVMRTARAMGIRTIAVHSDADVDARHVALADEAILIGEGPPADSYLRIDRILKAAAEASAEAVHPGYGFLSENAGFARAVIDAGLAWVGPAPETIEALGDKAVARSIMADAGLPVNDGGRAPDEEEALAIARRVGFPVMVKAAAGGGGIGMRIVSEEDDLRSAFASTQAQALRLFGDGSILIERFLPAARHVEVQILGLRDGTVLTLGDRDCSIQRRYQKVVEETPSPGVGPALRARILDAAATAASKIGYLNAGTVECLVSGDEFVFLEVNTRLQVEHPITEMVTGVDLVAAQLAIAAGDDPGLSGPAIDPVGHAIELRIYAEDPVKFFPRPGTIGTWSPPDLDGVRVDSGYGPGDVVSPLYDPLLAKLCVWGPDREAAIDRARSAVDAFDVDGITVNLPFLAEVLRSEDFVSGAYDTSFVDHLREREGA